MLAERVGVEGGTPTSSGSLHRLRVDMDRNGEVVFHSMASDLVPDQSLLGVSISHHDIFSWFVLLCCYENSELYARGLILKCIFITGSLMAIFHIACNMVGKTKGLQVLISQDKRS